MATLTEVRNRILRQIGDPQGSTYGNDVIDDAIQSALIATCKWIPKNRVLTLAGDSEATSFALPANLYRINSVYDESRGFFIPQINLVPGNTPGTGKSSNNQLTGNDWLEFPEGYISFSNAPDGNVIVYYGELWQMPVGDEDTLEIPNFLITAITYFSCGYLIITKAVDSANIRQYNVKVDSGTPTENPLRDMSIYFFKLFENEMNSLPARAKGAMS